MKTKTLRKNKVNVITLGCSKNLVDSEVLMGQLKANNFEVEYSDELSDSNILVINTCGFIENAKQQSIETILNCVDAKRKGKVEKVYVTGCLSERYKDDLQKEITDVDAWFGTKDLPRLLKTLKADYKHELIGERLLTTPVHYAYLKISEGCDRPCSFCAIPIMRGKHVSIPIEKIIEETRNLVKNGTKEIILIAQDLTYYGLDIYKKRNLAELLEKLSDVNGLDWIRLHYAYPSGFPLEVLDVMREKKNICNYLDIPLQHISDNMLKSMRRGITKEKTIELAETIRERVPGIAIRTTLIAGYPGETKQDHEEMLEWIKESKFERLGVFTYSHEDDTHAFTLKDDVPQKEKQRRADAVMKVQQKISAELNKKMIGKTFKVLFDKKEGNYFIGRTEFDSPDVDNTILVEASPRPSPKDSEQKQVYVRIGDFAEVKIISAKEYDLIGEVVK
ncbi:MAG: 30S ribosomal protein S12 methylthiotransferase RimO [Bacteroidetes bacterium]|nr:30S ribosomal protein S12 methylthiotransferase RimO [Bacteroidota bacterium]